MPATKDRPRESDREVSGPHDDVPRPASALARLVAATTATGRALASDARRLVAQVVDPDYLVALAQGLLDMGHVEAARDTFRRATQRDAYRFDAWRGLGEAAHRLGNDEAAIEAWTQALQIRPGAHEIHTLLGALHRRRGHHKQAFTHMYQAAQHCPQQRGTKVRVDRSSKPAAISPWFPLGDFFWEQGNACEALEYYDRALTDDVCDAKAEYLRGLIALAREDWQEGWRRFEYRRVLRSDLPREGVPHPYWNGDCKELAHQQMMVHSEGRLSDDILFAAWLPELIRRAGGVTIRCAAPLERLFARSFPDATVVAHPWNARPVPHIRWQTALGSLPRHLGMQAAMAANSLTTEIAPVVTTPLGARQGGYLVPDWKLTRMWQRRVAQLGPGRKIGLAGWRTLCPPSSRPAAKEVAGAAPWSALWEVPGVRWLMLDGLKAGEAADALPAHVHSFRTMPSRRELDEWAALLASLDLVITTPGVLAHLAGAVGVPVWVLTPTLAPWCWGVHGQRSRWYPTARLFRQASIHTWDDVISAVAEELASW